MTVLYTAPTAIRVHAWGRSVAEQSRHTLRLLGSVSEPNQPRKLDVVRTSDTAAVIGHLKWQTETGTVAVTPLPGLHVRSPVRDAPFPGSRRGRDGAKQASREGAAELLALAGRGRRSCAICSRERFVKT